MIIACAFVFTHTLHSMEVDCDQPAHGTAVPLKEAILKAIAEPNQSKRALDLEELTGFFDWLCPDQKTFDEGNYLKYLRKLNLGTEVNIEYDIYHLIMVHRGINYRIVNPKKRAEDYYLHNLIQDYLTQTWSETRWIQLKKFIDKAFDGELDRTSLRSKRTALSDVLSYIDHKRTLGTGNRPIVGYSQPSQQVSEELALDLVIQLLKCKANPHVRYHTGITAARELVRLYPREGTRWLNEYSQLGASHQKKRPKADNTAPATRDTSADVTEVFSNATVTSTSNNSIASKNPALSSSGFKFLTKFAITAVATIAIAFCGYKLFNRSTHTDRRLLR